MNIRKLIAVAAAGFALQQTVMAQVGTTPVQGEVWKCPASMLSMLDEYEGVVDSLFRRIGVEATLEDGSPIGCWAYVAGPKLSRKLVPARRVFRQRRSS